MTDLSQRLQCLQDIIGDAEKNNIDLSKGSKVRSVYGFRKNKSSYHAGTFEGAFRELKKEIWSLGSSYEKNSDALIELLLLLRDLEKQKSNVAAAKEIIRKMIPISSTIIDAKAAAPSMLRIRMPQLPPDIRPDVEADIREIEKSFNAGLYRSATILCGRVLETILHRKYFEATGNDLLEKSPGIGLGNIIAKLKENNVELAPALTQQIHMINQVRIFSVHKKQQPFCPTKEQAHAMILYTTDVIARMW